MVIPFVTLLFSIGGLLFGIAVIRAGIITCWAAIVFIIGTVSALVVALLPEVAGRIIRKWSANPAYNSGRANRRYNEVC